MQFIWLLISYTYCNAPSRRAGGGWAEDKLYVIVLVDSNEIDLDGAECKLKYSLSGHVLFREQ